MANEICEVCKSTDYNWAENCFVCEKCICSECVDDYCDRLEVNSWDEYWHETFEHPAEKPFICKGCKEVLRSYAERARVIRNKANKEITKIQKELEEEIEGLKDA